MNLMEISLLGIALATVIGMVLGALWYSPLLFGNLWMKCIGKTPETLGSSTVPMIGAMLASLLSATGVAVVVSLTGTQTLGGGLCIGLVLGLLLIFPALLSDNLFCGWGFQLLLIQAGYRIASVVLMAMAVVSIN